MDTPSAHRILIVDDHSVVRRGFRQLFDEQADLDVCAEASTAVEAMDQAEAHAPDLALVDITLGNGINGLNLINRFHTEHDALRTLAVSMHDETLYAQRALAAGARGYVMKRVSDEMLVEAVREVLAGRIYVSDAVKERILATGASPSAEAPSAEAPSAEAPSAEAPSTPVDQLTDRELEIFLLVGEGFAPRHIAERLHLSVKTIETHRRHLKQKLHLESSAELTRYAVAWRVERSTSPET